MRAVRACACSIACVGLGWNTAGGCVVLFLRGRVCGWALGWVNRFVHCMMLRTRCVCVCLCVVRVVEAALIRVACERVCGGVTVVAMWAVCKSVVACRGACACVWWGDDVVYAGERME